jgi:hypothetical protein
MKTGTVFYLLHSFNISPSSSSWSATTLASKSS